MARFAAAYLAEWWEKQVSAVRPRRSGRVPIEVSTDIEAVVDAAQDALLRLPGPRIFQRGGLLVRITRDGSRSVPGLTRPPGTSVITTLPNAHLTELMTRCAVWWKPNGPGGSRVRTLPPPWAVQALQDRGAWPF